ncbi:hypothetical protein ABZ387_36495 [Streptomyces flaveolus]|uniref:MmyB family transcriptional regulator n=1 Tax=Streptomyces flaveolus TaxID=67297 RepID=UPI0033DF782F
MLGPAGGERGTEATTSCRAEFAIHDPDFASSWGNHAVRHTPSVRKSMQHPTLGELKIDRHTLALPGSDCSLVMYTAEAGSPSAASLKSL